MLLNTNSQNTNLIKGSVITFQCDPGFSLVGSVAVNVTNGCLYSLATNLKLNKSSVVSQRNCLCRCVLWCMYTNTMPYRDILLLIVQICNWKLFLILFASRHPRLQWSQWCMLPLALASPARKATPLPQWTSTRSPTPLWMLLPPAGNKQPPSQPAQQVSLFVW